MRRLSSKLCHLATWFCLLTCVPVAIIGCEVSVEDVKKWENAKLRKEKMKEFLLGENSLDVKAEAIMILIRQGEGSSLMAVLPEVSEAERLALYGKVIPQLAEMVVGESQAMQLRGKDGAYYLAQTSPPDDVRETLRDLLVLWVDGDNFWRPLDAVGDVDRIKIFEEAGSKGLPVIENLINDRFDKLGEAKSAARKQKLMQDIQMLVQLAKEMNVAESDARIATAFLSRMEKAYPNLPEVYAIPFLSNKTPELKAMAKRIVKDPDYTSDELNTLRDLIINEYYTKVQTKEGVSVCGTVLREDRSGFMRWMCARTLLKTAGEAGIDHVFLGIPDDPKALEMPADHPLAGSYDLPRYFWEESEAFCRSSAGLLDGKVPVNKFREYLKAERTVQKILAITCLSYHGTDADMESLRGLASDATDLKPWNGPADTLGQFAVMAADAHEQRVQQPAP